MKQITFEEIIGNRALCTYVNKGNELLGVLGYTDHSAVHTGKVGETAADILIKLGYSGREAELAKIAGYMHDIGNVISRTGHAQTGALMAFHILTEMKMEPEEIAIVIAAIGNHDEDSGIAVSPVSAAIIIADKTDVRRSRVRNYNPADIHDRVNYAVEETKLYVAGGQNRTISDTEGSQNRTISLEIKIDTAICSVMDYFEIFLTRMLMCKRAAEFLNAKFQMIANEAKLL